MSINSNLVLISEEYIDIPEIIINIYSDNILTFTSKHLTTGDWVNKLKNELNENVYNISKAKIEIILLNCFYNKKIMANYKLKDDQKLSYQYIDMCIKKLLNYVRK